MAVLRARRQGRRLYRGALPGGKRLAARLVGAVDSALGRRGSEGRERNPGIGFSDAMGMINYGDWTGSQEPREA
jgi:hypothetical protein